MSKTVNWIIHLCANGIRCDCGRIENGFHPYICNAHTHGMNQYGHLDFQLVISLPTREISEILNSFGLRVQAGERFKDGDFVSGIYEDCDVRLTEFQETGRKVLRIIIPDGKNRFPEEEGCDCLYVMQRVTEEELYRKGGWTI